MKLLKIICVFAFLPLAACKSSVRSYDEVKTVVDEIRRNPHESHAWNDLYRYTDSPNSWDQFYGYTFLARLGMGEIPSEQKRNAIAILKKGLVHGEHGAQRECVMGIRDIGNEALQETFNELAGKISAAEEDDVTWFSAQAFSKIEDKSLAIKALDILKRASLVPSTPEKQRGALELRKESIDSAVILAKSFLTPMEYDSYFEDIIDRADPQFADYVRKKANAQ